MRPSRNKVKILPKISTMPRPQTEAAAFLALYKLAIEKKRLHQELESLDQRRQQIFERLALLDQQAAVLEAKDPQALPPDPQPKGYRPAVGQAKPALRRSNTTPPLTEEFDTLFLEY